VINVPKKRGRDLGQILRIAKKKTERGEKRKKNVQMRTHLHHYCPNQPKGLKENVAKTMVPENLKSQRLYNYVM